MRILAAPLSVALSAALRAARLAVPRLARATWLGLGLGLGFGFGLECLLAALEAAADALSKVSKAPGSEASTW